MYIMTMAVTKTMISIVTAPIAPPTAATGNSTDVGDVGDAGAGVLHSGSAIEDTTT